MIPRLNIFILFLPKKFSRRFAYETFLWWDTSCRHDIVYIFWKNKYVIDRIFSSSFIFCIVFFLLSCCFFQPRIRRQRRRWTDDGEKKEKNLRFFFLFIVVVDDFLCDSDDSDSLKLVPACAYDFHHFSRFSQFLAFAIIPHHFFLCSRNSAHSRHTSTIKMKFHRLNFRFLYFKMFHISVKRY